ncbi:hypothetical protein YC2023_042548 [Brassica napus]
MTIFFSPIPNTIAPPSNLFPPRRPRTGSVKMQFTDQSVKWSGGVGNDLTHIKLLCWKSLPECMQVKKPITGAKSLIHAYAVGRDMEEGIEMSLVTYSFIVGGFSKAGNAE